jgi:hypothetical protein
VDAHAGAARYDKKIAGAAHVLHYPPDEKVIAADGTEKRAYEVARDTLTAIEAGKPIAMPNEYAGGIDDIRNMSGPDRKRWILEIIEDKTPRQPTFIARLEYLDKCLLRSYMVPERSAIEAVNAGSRADSGTAADIVLTIAELLHQDIARMINWHIVDQLLVINYGEKARGTVYITPQPLQDATRSLITDIVKTVFTAPANVDLLTTLLDFDAMLDQAGLPKSENIDAALENGPTATPATDPSTGNVATDPAMAPASENAYDGLNGAQITAALSVLDRMASGNIDRTQAIELLKAMQVPPDQAVRIVGSGSRRRPPAPQPMPANQPATRALLSLVARLNGR